jgi:hypothetical protein
MEECYILETEAGGFSKILVRIYQTLQCNSMKEQSLKTLFLPPPTSLYNFMYWQEVGTELISLPTCSLSWVVSSVIVSVCFYDSSNFIVYSIMLSGIQTM